MFNSTSTVPDSIPSCPDRLDRSNPYRDSHRIKRRDSVAPEEQAGTLRWNQFGLANGNPAPTP